MKKSNSQFSWVILLLVLVIPFFLAIAMTPTATFSSEPKVALANGDEEYYVNDGEDPGVGDDGEDPGVGDDGEDPGVGDDGEDPGVGDDGEDPGVGDDGGTSTTTNEGFYIDGVTDGTEINKRIGQIVSLITTYALADTSPTEGIACSVGISKKGYSSVTGAKSNYPDSEFLWRPVAATPIGGNQYLCKGVWETNLSTQTGYHIFSSKIVQEGVGTPIHEFSYVRYLKVVDTENNGTIGLNVASTAVKQGESVRLSGQPNGIDATNAAKNCYFYVGKSGNYVLKGKSALNSCSYDWNTAGTAEGLHSVLVNIQDTNEANPSWSRMPSDTETIRVCTGGGECKGPNKISIWADPAGVKQGSPITIHVYVSNPNDAELANKQEYYLFIGDGNGRHYLKTHGAISSCSQNQQGCTYTWDTSADSVIGLHSVVVSLQAGGLPNPTVFASPNVQTTVRVCSKDASSCAGPNQGSNEGPGGPGQNGGGGLGDTTVNTISHLLTGARGEDGKPSPRRTAIDIPSVTLPKFKDIYEFLQIIAWKWFPVIIGAAAFFGILIAGFTIVTAGGDAEKAKKGRLAIVYIATGMILATLSWIIVRVVANELINLGWIKSR